MKQFDREKDYWDYLHYNLAWYKIYSPKDFSPDSSKECKMSQRLIDAFCNFYDNY